MPPHQRKGKQPADKGKKSATVKGKGKGNSRVPFNSNITDIFEADDNEQKLSRKGHELDEVDDYEYNVGEIQDEDDEDIDSDEAFDESDEEKFENFKFQGSTKSSDKKKQMKKNYSINSDSNDENALEEDNIDLNEDDSEQDDINSEDGEDYVDLSDMLDGQPKEKTHKNILKKLMPAEESDSDSTPLGAMEDSEDEEDEEEEEEEGDASEAIMSFIDTLETKKRKNSESDRKNKKVHIEERTEVYEENEFNLLARSSENTGSINKKKVDLNDLMSSFSNSAEFETMRKSLLALDGKGKNTEKKALEAPLPKRLQDRMERQVAYTEANKELGRWQATIKQNREADHLSFPMQAPLTEKMSNTTLASKFKAETGLEKEIEKALQEAGMKDEELEAFEALQLNKLSIEEVKKRRDELRMMRELMFRHEIKARRLGKIKSKSYRKLQRKEKSKLEQQIKNLEEVDHEISHQDQVKAAMDRAEERMTLKHKNTGQWAKRALARGGQDEGTREAILEQLQRGDQLRRKIQGRDTDDESEEESDDDSNKFANEKEDIMSQLAKLEASSDEPIKKGIMSMKFMQDAAKRQMDINSAELDAFKEEWLSDNSDAEESDVKEPVEEPTYSIVQNNPGRMAFGVKKNENKIKNDELPSKQTVVLNDAGQTKSVSHGTAHNARTSGFVDTQPTKKNDSPLADLDDQESNPWLQHDTSRLGKKAAKANKAQTNKSDNKSDQNIEKIKKLQKEAKAAQDTDDVKLDLSKTLTISSAKANTNAKANANANAKSKKKQKTNKATAVVTSTAESDDDNEEEDARLEFTQRELVARAFAHDNVVAEFEEEKKKVVAEDDDKVEDLTLPGWGTWGGSGVKAPKKKKVLFTRTIKGIAPEKRKDNKLANVIINERKNKKAEKYQVTHVPFPFQNMEQYERSLRAPVGKEWNTRDVFQKMTKPKVMTKLGTVIDPLSAPF
ncbi:small-subunit processome [Spinellus fusiger]|nr:small-subunit processome [Spinellus fusiger]